LLKFFLEFEKGQVAQNSPIFKFQNGQVARKNKPISGKYRGLRKLFLGFQKR
jgi:hypothetical protein